MPAAFSVVAIIAAFNEADIIGQVVADLVAQGIDVYFLDDGSTDRTIAEVEPYLGRGVLAIERREDVSGDRAPSVFEWERILLRKAQLAQELDADWFIHHDADEFRESPWLRLTLKDAIERVDALGFNAIDFTSLDFWPVHDSFHAGDDVRAAFPFYAERAPYDRLQIRCWKKTPDLDLASSGGHDAQFGGRNVFPVRFILRHYPIRGQAHGERKVFRERQNRFLDRERARGWHVQYDDTHEDASFIRDSSTLTRYDAEAVRVSLTLHHRGVEALEASLADARSAGAVQRAEIERRDAELGQLHDELGALRQQVAQGVARLAELRAQLDARNAQVGQLTDALAHRGMELELREAQVAQLTDALAHRGMELELREAQVAQLTAALGRRTTDVERLEQTVDERTRLLDEVHRSLSWRWTSPLRALARLLRLP